MEPASDWVTNRMGSALEFAGTDFISVGVKDYLSLPNALTVAGWLTSNLAADSQTIVTSWAADSADRQFLTKLGETQIQFFLEPSGGGAAIFWSAAAKADHMTANILVHLTFWWDGSEQRLYVNGLQVAQRDSAFTLESISNTPLDIAGSSLFQEELTGTISELRIYNRALSSREVRLIYDIPYADLIPKSRVLAKAPVVAPGVGNWPETERNMPRGVGRGILSGVV